ncbi:MAG: Asp-tRNA(Asn)/Glu-tRNA(Gln) amidotransferase subunit GatA [Phycisphaerae bacterium]
MPASVTVAGLAEAVRSKKQSAEEVVRACCDAIEETDERFHTFISCDRERALARAREIDAGLARGEVPGALAGVPLAVKDNICTAFGATTCGSKILENFRSTYGATAVERLESAGAVLVGKTNLDAFAMGASTEYSAYFTTRNPWDPGRVSGGSSGGSAAAVALRSVPAALGSDTGGSIRQPASYCGVVGLKPTYGRVSRYGLVAFGSSLDQIGPIATTVHDAALLLGVIAGHDARDSTSVDAPVPRYVAALGRPLKGLRVGISKEYFGEGLSADVRRGVEDALKVMTGAGAVTVSVDLPHMKYATACYYIVAPAEASSNLARFDGVHFGYRTGRPADMFDLYASSRGEGLGAEVKRRIMLGTYVLSSGYYDRYYVKALKVRTLIKADFDRAFELVDVIASPVAPTTPFPIGEKCDDPLAMYLNDIYTISANLAGICGISVPCGFGRDGLPIGLQLMGPVFGEEKILAAAHQYQLLTDHHTKVPAATSWRYGNGAINDRLTAANNPGVVRAIV